MLTVFLDSASCCHNDLLILLIRIMICENVKQIKLFITILSFIYHKTGSVTNLATKSWVLVAQNVKFCFIISGSERTYICQ